MRGTVRKSASQNKKIFADESGSSSPASCFQGGQPHTPQKTPISGVVVAVSNLLEVEGQWMHTAPVYGSSVNL